MLLLVGDSHLARLEDHHRLLLRRLSGATGLVDWAVGGATSTDLLRELTRRGEVSAERVVVSIGTNDASAQRRTPLPDFSNTLARVMTELQGSRVVCVGAPPVAEDRLPAPDHSNAVQREFSQAAARQTDAHGARFVDSFAVLAAQLRAGVDVHDADGLHLAPAGYDALVPAIAAAIRL